MEMADDGHVAAEDAVQQVPPRQGFAAFVQHCTVWAVQLADISKMHRIAEIVNWSRRIAMVMACIEERCDIPDSQWI